MSDLAFAAAAAGCQQPVDMDTLHESQAAALESPRGFHDSNPFELPSVDDLEVAAAAAAATMQAMQELQQESEDDEDTSSSSTDSESEESSDQSVSEDLAAIEQQQQQSQQQQQHQLKLRLTPAPDGRITVVIDAAEPQPQPKQQQQQQGLDVEMVAAGDGASSSSCSSSSSSSSSDSSSSDVESIDYNEMRDFIDKAYKVVDDEEDGGPAPSLEEDLGLPGKIAPLTDITVPADAELKQAGSIMSVLEGMVVIQGLANSRALDYGSVILLEDKTPIGRIEEVFGPITHPLYALRYAGPQPASSGLVADSRVFYTDSLASLVEDQVYTEAKTGKQKKAVVDYDPEVEEEPDFSDDEAETEWRRSQGLTKRKAAHGTAADSNSNSSGRGRGRGRYGGGTNNSRGGRGGPSAGFRAHATAGQLQTLGLQQNTGGQGARGRRGGRGRGQQGGRAANGSMQQQQQQQQQQQSWQPGVATAYNGYPTQQQYYPGMQQMVPGAYGYPAQQMGPYLQQPMAPQPLMMQHPPGAGGYGHPAMMAGSLAQGGVPPHIRPPQVPAGAPTQPGMYHNLPSAAQQWTGFGSPPPHSG